MCKVALAVARDVSLLCIVNNRVQAYVQLWYLHPVRPVGAPASRNRVLATFARR